MAHLTNCFEGAGVMRKMCQVLLKLQNYTIRHTKRASASDLMCCSLCDGSQIDMPDVELELRVSEPANFIRISVSR